MDGPRAPSPNEFSGLLDFLKKELRPEESWSIDREYPVAFSPQNIGNIRIIKDEADKVLSHAVLRPMIVKTPVGLFKVGAIGSVVTATDSRNQGYSQQILQSCLELAMQNGCEIAVLWTNLHDFYRKIGFELAGSEVSLSWDRDYGSLSKGLRFMDTHKVAPEAIHKLFNTHTVTSLRTLEDTRQYLAIPNARLYTAWDESNALKAYAVEGKGADLNGYLHEWGGSVSALLPLFDYIQRTQKRAITVMVPAHSQNLIQKATALGVKHHQGYLGMIKLLNSSNLFTKIKRHARSLGIMDLVMETRAGQTYFGFPNQVFKTDSESDIVRLIFGPQKPSEIYPFEGETAEKLDRILPLKMWIWGWDSI